MFYSKIAKPINNNWSVLNPTQVFVGEYWDEFGITSYFVPEKGKVLILGLAYGGCIRPLLSSEKKIEIIAVDLNQELVLGCQKYFEHGYKNIEFTSVVDDAKSFLERTTDQFDAIWVDIYGEKNYLEITQDLSFYQLITTRLKKDGTVFVNSFGLPFQFDPLTNSPVQNKIQVLLGQTFSEVSVLPFRRNITLIARNQKFSFQKVNPNKNLKPLDQVAFKVLGQRVFHLNWKNSKPDCSLDVITNLNLEFDSINKIMANKWIKLIQIIRLFDAEIYQPKDFLAVIQNADISKKIIFDLIKHNRNLVFFFPILIAGQMRVSHIKANWIFQFTDDNHDFLKKELGKDFFNVWLNQLWSMVLHPSKQYLQFNFSVRAMFARGGNK